MAHVAEPGLAAGGLAVQPAIGIAGEGMGIVFVGLAMKVGAIVAIAAVLGAEALVGSPGFDQRAVHREMLVRQQRLHLGKVQQPGHELREHVAVLQSLKVLREGGRVLDSVVWRQPGRPAIQQVVVQLLHQLSFRADAMEHLQ